MTRNYQLVYYDAENVGIIWILAYPKITTYLKLKMLRYFLFLQIAYPFQDKYILFNEGFGLFFRNGLLEYFKENTRF